MKRHLIIALVLLTSAGFGTLHAQTTIAQARAASLGSTVTIKGIALNGSELGIIRYIQDGSAGIAAYGTSLSLVKVGDSVIVTGTTKTYNELIEIDPITNVQVISSGNPLPAPKTISPDALFTEAYESQLVQVVGASFVLSGNFSGDTNYKLNNAGSTQKEVRISSSTDLVDKVIPSGSVTVTGILSQYKTTYQLLPRTLADLSSNSGPGVIRDLRATAISQNSISVSFSTSKAGSTSVKYGLTPALELGTATTTGDVIEHTATLNGLQPATIYFTQAISTNVDGTSTGNIFLLITASTSSGRMQILFNLPVDNSVSTGTPALYIPNALEDSLVKYIDAAQNTIDFCVYNLNNSGINPDITEALNQAFGRGLRVRVISDGGSANIGLKTLNPGIKSVKSPTSSGFRLMHNKFIVIDAQSASKCQVWTGSANLNQGQLHEDAQNVLIIQDQSLAKAYELEFDEMWGSTTANPGAGKFGAQKTDNIPHFYNIGGTPVELYFSPSDGVNNKIIETVNTADNEIYLSLLVFTRPDIRNAILDRTRDGVWLAGVIDDTTNGAGGIFRDLQTASNGRYMKFNGSGIYHHKYMIVDPNQPTRDPIVLTGSHNWSSSADQYNDENTLIIHSASIANQYYQEWVRRYKENGGTTLYQATTVGEVSAFSTSTLSLKNYTFNDGLLLTQLESSFGIANLRASLVDMSGRVVASLPNVNINDGGTIAAAIPVGDLSKGIYALRFVHTKGAVTYKIAIQ